MDLKNFNTVETSNKGSVLSLLHPATGVPIGATITLAGVDSERYRKAQREVSNRRLKNIGRAPVKMTAEEIEFDAITILAKCTMAWEGIEENGSSLPCNFETAKQVYIDYPWIREQVDQFVNDRANFLSD